MQSVYRNKIITFLLAIWQHFSFSDVSKIMKGLSNRQAEKHDLDSVPYINKLMREKDNYPDFHQAIIDLRKSPFFAIMKYEFSNLITMFIIHIVDVMFSISAALLSVQLLRTFEKGSLNFHLIMLFFSNPNLTQKIYFSIFLALFIFLLNIIAASLHSQKVEKEMFLSWKIPNKLVLYGYFLLLNMSRKSRNKFRSGDIANVAQNDTRFLADYYSHVFVDIPVLIVSTFFVFFIMQIMIGKIAWFGFIMICLQIPISLFLSWIGNIFHKELMKRVDNRIHLVTEWIQAMRLIRYFGWEKYFEKEIHAAATSEFIQGFKITTKYSLAYAVTTNWWMVVSSAIFAGVLYLNGKKDASTIFATIWLSTILGNLLTPLPWFVNIFSQSIVASDRLKTFYKSNTQQEDFDKSKVNSLTAQELELVHLILNKNKSVKFSLSFLLENISLRFSENEPWIFKNFSLEIEANKTLAVLGPVGSGKSLFIQLLMGEIIPNFGDIYLIINIDFIGHKRVKININTELGIQILRNTQSYVAQEAFIFSATIAENVPLIYNSDINEKQRNRIMNALYAASMEDDIERFINKIDTEVGEKGVNLSGGQRQRINLSRSAFQDSCVLFLDDPLSALDALTEEELANNIFLGDWGRNKTIIWSTHRLDFVSYASTIVFIEDGSIVEKGSYAELISDKKSKLYSLIVGAE